MEKNNKNNSVSNKWISEFFGGKIATKTDLNFYLIFSFKKFKFFIVLHVKYFKVKFFNLSHLDITSPKTQWHASKKSTP
jgi:hypothetical protein